jgi:isopenicillin-N epimerase
MTSPETALPPPPTPGRASADATAAGPGRLAAHWTLDPAIDYLNHGAFGACPRAVLAAQAELRAELERQPVEFFVRRLPGLLDGARERLAAFVGTDPESLVAVSNATSGVNTVLRSLAPALRPGDELLTTDHAYNACSNALDFVAAAAGARVVVATVPFPSAGPEEVVAAVLAAVTDRTRLALIDHVTSPTGLVLPAAELIASLAARGVDTLLDAAHSPGMLPLAIDELGAAYVTGNCHKWMCAPKGAAFLAVRADRRERVRPLVISHGYNARRPGRSRLHDEFDWPGTTDPTPFLCLPAAIDTMAGMVAGGWPEVMRRNRELAIAARRLLVGAARVPAPAPETMLGSLAAVPLPPAREPAPAAFGHDPLEDLLRERRFELPVFTWPPPGGPKPTVRVLRIAAQLYNRREQYERLAAALGELLA